ncbi:hypothetical protein AA0472_2284 [Acetobacter estunensis NRIC 0472]|nr:hypothetical protein AA0472_2284 [Acetobacter estunensis NRIC 0472]
MLCLKLSGIHHGAPVDIEPSDDQPFILYVTIDQSARTTEFRGYRAAVHIRHSLVWARTLP